MIVLFDFLLFLIYSIVFKGDYMETYDSNKLFIGYIGNTYTKDYRLYMKRQELAITKQDSYSLSHEYTDIFSDKEYKAFNSSFCTSGDYAILEPKSLTSFIAKLCSENSKFIEIDIIRKIANGQYISDQELKKFLFALNTSLNGGKNIYDMLYNDSEEKKIHKNHIIKLNYVAILNNKKFKLHPITGRDNEINEIINTLAESKKIPILIGKRGVGKTIIIDELAYRIKTNNVPNFLKKRKIIELSLPKLFINPKNIEDKVIRLIKTAINNDSIIFIDEFDTIDNKNYNILELLKEEIKKNNLKVIGAIHSEKDNKNFTDDIFNKIKINEPDDTVLYEIIEKTFYYYSKLNNIKLPKTLDTLIKILIDLTRLENRILKNENASNKTSNYDMYNPELVIEIIDKMFAEAKIQNSKKLTSQNILCAINSCKKIKENIKRENISNIEKFHLNEIEEKTKK